MSSGCAPGGIARLFLDLPAQYPRVSGQWAPYTQSQLELFRSGKRANSPQMEAIAARLSDNEIKALADYMAGLH